MKYIYLCLLLLMSSTGFAQLRGQVVDEQGSPLPGATLLFNNNIRPTDKNGRFVMNVPAGNYNLKISFVGYRDTSLTVKVPGDLIIALRPLNSQLREVRVSTGYQELPKERATGSFVQVDRALIERGVSTSLIDRLRDNVPGLSFNDRGTAFSVRGQSTLFSNAEPLIVVDGFQYNQPLTNINPNDVEGVSVLKDAAAASIWGAKAANGVIVITTKKGRFNQAAKVSGSATVSVTGRPDLDYRGHMSASDYIDIEKRLFSSGFYTAKENDPQHLPLSPVIELLIAARDGKLSAAAANAQIDALRGNDVNAEFKKYFYRPSLNQQYAANIAGGSGVQRYYFSAGYDKDLDNLNGNSSDRITLNAKNTWQFFQNKLEYSADIGLVQGRTLRNSPGGLYWDRGQLIYPYAHFAGPDGEALAVTKDYRQGFLTAAQAAGLLDWSYRPLDELNGQDNVTRQTEQRLHSGLRYRLPLGLTAEVLYQYARLNTDYRNLQDLNTYYARDLINHYTQVAGTVLVRPVPLGGIVDLNSAVSDNHNIRGQLNFDRTIRRHQVTALAGYEEQTLHVQGNSSRIYGYDSEHAIGQPVDLVSLFPYYDNPVSSGNILSNLGETDATDHYRSYYANAAYTYDGRLTLSGSARLDRSNLFGVRSNQKGVPLWSAGAAWNVSKEGFYQVAWLPELKLRATFGYNGNINKNLSAYTTASYSDASGSIALLPYATINNPPNPELRWERVRNTNLAIDLGTLNGRLSGSAEYFWKQGLDLIGNTAFAPSTGIQTFTGNTARTAGQGMDLQLRAQIFKDRLGWVTELIASWYHDKVTAYAQTAAPAQYITSSNNGSFPLAGRPLYGIYTYAWGGLDPANGDPRGYLNGALSKDYTAIMSTTKAEDLVYSGPANPTAYGALRNTFTYRHIVLSVTLNYKLGYYFRRNRTGYGTDQGLSAQSGDYPGRWQQPGDESLTDIPSVPATPNTQRDLFFIYSSANVYRGDHIRLQDVRLSYDLPKVQVYAYATDLPYLWRANQAGIDPLFPNSPPAPLTLAFGLRFNY